MPTFGRNKLCPRQDQKRAEKTDIDSEGAEQGAISILGEALAEDRQDERHEGRYEDDADRDFGFYVQTCMSSFTAFAYITDVGSSRQRGL